LLVDLFESYDCARTCERQIIGCIESPTQRPLPDNTQHLQQTDIHGPGGIRTHNPSRRTVAGPRHWDWPTTTTI